MLNLIKQAAVDVAKEIAGAGLPAVEIGLDAGNTASGARQFVGGAAVGSEPTQIRDTDNSIPVVGALAHIGSMTLRQTSPDNGADTAKDSGPAQNTVLILGRMERPLGEHVQKELAA